MLLARCSSHQRSGYVMTIPEGDSNMVVVAVGKDDEGEEQG